MDIKDIKVGDRVTINAIYDGMCSGRECVVTRVDPVLPYPVAVRVDKTGDDDTAEDIGEELLMNAAELDPAAP